MRGVARHPVRFAMAAADLVVAFTGASGAPYGVRLLEVLLRRGRTVHLTMSPAAVEVIQQELDRAVRLDHFELADLLGVAASGLPGRVEYHHYRNFRAGVASGSFLTGGMVICPCSMGTVGAIAHGLSQNLIHRAADVHLKERRKLVLVPRETPLGLIQLRNLNIDPEVLLPRMPDLNSMGKALGIKKMIEILRKEVPQVELGNFTRPVQRVKQATTTTTMA